MNAVQAAFGKVDPYFVAEQYDEDEAGAAAAQTLMAIATQQQAEAAQAAVQQRVGV